MNFIFYLPNIGYMGYILAIYIVYYIIIGGIPRSYISHILSIPVNNIYIYYKLLCIFFYT